MVVGSCLASGPPGRTPEPLARTLNNTEPTDLDWKLYFVLQGRSIPPGHLGEGLTERLADFLRVFGIGRGVQVSFQVVDGRTVFAGAHQRDAEIAAQRRVARSELPLPIQHADCPGEILALTVDAAQVVEHSQDDRPRRRG